MKKSDWFHHILDAAIFFICYVISLSILLFLGFGRLASGNLMVYSIIFGILETVKILLLKWKARIILFFFNIYLSYWLASFYFVVRDKANIIKAMASIIANEYILYEYILLIGISLLISFVGYIFLIIHSIKLKWPGNAKSSKNQARGGSNVSSDSTGSMIVFGDDFGEN